MTPEESQYNDLLTQFGQFTIVMMLLPALVALVRYRYLNKPGRVFFGYLVATISVNIIEQLFIWSTDVNTYYSFWEPYLIRWQIDNTYFLQILAYLKNFLFLGWFYGLILVPVGIGQWTFRISVLLALLALIDYVWISGYNQPAVLTPTLSGLYTTLLPMLQLWFLIQQQHKVSLVKIPYVWFSTGLILANLFTLLFFLFNEKIYQTDFLLFVKMSLARNCLEIVSQVLFAYGFWQAKTLRYL
ncbi:hypothetical protein GCM10027299_16080 [Larkinella ripae]